MKKKHIKILHITEALGGGVLHLLSHLAKAKVSDGHDVVIAHSLRADTPINHLSELFPNPIRRIVIPMVTQISPVNDLKALRDIVFLISREKPDVIHLHSSKAGVLGRLAATILGKRKKVFYSPHGFSFLRVDISATARKLFLNFERYVGLLGGVLLASSQTEFELAHKQLANKEIILVENCVDLDEVPVAMGSKSGRVRVITTARICYQKAPWRFRDLAVACDDLPADFVWLGDGNLRNELLISGELPKNLCVLGTQTRSEAYSRLLDSDLFVLPSLWEGMPLALIEAQVAGLPAIVSDVVGNRDVVLDGVTGFVCDSDRTLIEKTRLLIENPLLRKQMGERAREMALNRFGVSRMHNEIMRAYGYKQDAGAKC